ncbi:U3 small nucleolar RNA-associated protein 12, partial [Clonorchis sinensis]
DSEINVLDLVSGTGSKLRGHKGLITRLRLINFGPILVSSAQDSFIKFWDLRNMHCFATLTGHPGPVWDFALSTDDRLLVSGTADSQLRLWRLTYFDQEAYLSEPPPSEAEPLPASGEEVIVPLSQRQALIQAEFLGCVRRSGSRRVHTLLIDQTGTFILCQSFDRNLELFRVLDEEAKAKRLKKKVKKARDKGEGAPSEVTLDISDTIRPLLRLTLPAKPASCDVLIAKPVWKAGTIMGTRLQFLCALKNNTVDELEVTIPVASTMKLQTISVVKSIQTKGVRVRLINRICAPGHRTPPVACCLTGDALGVFTLARTEAKLWSRHSSACLATLTWPRAGAEHVLEDAPLEDNGSKQDFPTRASAMVLAPGDRHVVIGFESGHLLLFDVQSKSMRQSIPRAHEGAVRGLVLSGDKKMIFSGGSDKQIGFYNFDLKISGNGIPTLCLVEARQHQSVADQITCLGVTPNGRLIIAGLVNFHVDVHFSDSLKRVHSLYGHAGPVTSLDVSADSRLVITGSADKTVRLWELQFGNCQRRFTSHVEPVTCVRFIPHTVLAVSGDMSGQIKQWDVAKLREVTTLKGHRGSVTCLDAIATNAALFAKSAKDIQKKKFKKRRAGKDDKTEADLEDEDDFDELAGGLIVSGGRDFSIRIWAESEELLILEEQEELAREEEEDEELVRSEAVIPGAIPAEASETGLLGRPTPNTRDAADMLMEAIDICEQEFAKKQLPPSCKSVPPPHPLMVARGIDCPDRFLLASLAELRAPNSRLGGGGAGLEHAVGAITTQHARRLLPRLANWLSRGLEVELVGRAIRHLVTLHFGLVVTSASLRDMLQESREARLNQIGKLKELFGMNLAALEYLKLKIEENQQKVLFEDLLTAREKRVQRQKVKRSRMALILPG